MPEPATAARKRTTPKPKRAGVLAEMLEQNGWQTTAPDGFDPDAAD